MNLITDLKYPQYGTGTDAKIGPHQQQDNTPPVYDTS